MTDLERIAMLEAEVANLQDRLAQYESAAVLTTKGLTAMPMLRPLRRRRGPVTTHRGSWETFGPSHTPTPLDP